VRAARLHPGDGHDRERPSAIEEGAMLKTTVMLICLLVIATGAEAKKDRNRVVMDFATMYGVDEAFVGANPIRDLVGDELPWEIVGGVHGRLTNRGHLRIRVRGLVFTHDPEVPPEKQGTNDEDQFRAVVSCLVEQGGQVVTQNVTTTGFPATPSGNSDIDAQLELPGECVAPIIFIIAGSEEKWFAVTGFSSE
jgi:hypothetical protein